MEDKIKTEITNREFWIKYWYSKKDNINILISKNYLFHDFFCEIMHRNKIKTSLEIGGFPGYFSIYLKKFFNVDTYLIDFVINKQLIEKLLKTNGLFLNDINIIEGDILTIKNQYKYDFVFSCGFIEHFQDTKFIIYRHLNFLKDKGSLLITIPNFRGLNGVIQYLFDKDNIKNHNLTCMVPSVLARICLQLGLKNVKVSYYGKFGVWLENIKDRNIIIVLLIRIISFLGRIAFKIFTLETRLFSPWIVVTAVNKK